MLLLQFGATRDSKACLLGLRQTNSLVRNIFQDQQNFSTQKMSFVSIGRRWSVEPSSGDDCGFSPLPAGLGRSSNRDSGNVSKDQGRFITTEDIFDDEVFPMLNSSRQPQPQQTLSSTWEASKVAELRQSMLPDEGNEAESSPNVPVEDFPKVIGRYTPHPLANAAQSSWRELKKLETREVIKGGQTFLQNGLSEQMPQVEKALKNTKKGKKRWYALQLG